MTVAFLFPGQGADLAGLAGAWRYHGSPVPDLIASAARHAGVSERELLAAGAAGTARTNLHQPALTAVSTGIVLALEEHAVRPDIVAGHSLGEVAACAAAGYMSAGDAVAVAALRVRVMAREAGRHPGGMIALQLVGRATAEAAIRSARAHGHAAIAAHNADDQWVVSGDWATLRAIAAAVPATPLAVAGPWHTEAMAGAVAEYRIALCEAIKAPLRVPLVCNRTGRVVEHADDLPDVLAGQLTRCVHWTDTMTTLAKRGVRHMVAVGAAKTLRALVRRQLGGDVTVVIVETPDDINRAREALAR